MVPKKTETQEIRRKQNIQFWGWMKKLLIVLIAGSVLLGIMEAIRDEGFTGKTSVNLGFANIEINSGEGKLNSTQEQQLENTAREPQAASFQPINQQGYCQYIYGTYSFSMYIGQWYSYSYDGPYVLAQGNGQFYYSEYGNVTQVSSTNGQWIPASNAGDIDVCSDPRGNYARFNY